MDNWTESDIVANGIRLHYRRTGGDKPPVVLCHGFSDDGLCWAPLAEWLQKDYDLIMVDARYHGLSEVPRFGHGSSAMAADLKGLIETLHLDRPIAAGHSMGASYVFYAAATYPDLLRAAILEDPVWRDAAPGEGSGRPTAWLENWRSDMSRWAEMTEDEVIGEFRLQHPGWDEAIYPRFAQAKRRLSLRVLEGPITPQRPWRELLAQVKVPLLVFTGDPSLGSIVTDAVASDAQAIAPQMEILHIAGVGHHIRFARPETYREEFARYLAWVYARGAIAT